MVCSAFRGKGDIYYVRKSFVNGRGYLQSCRKLFMISS
jgi:hypothetical protein